MSSVLLVEGGSDVDFFLALLQSLELTSVQVKPPRDFARMNSVTVFPALIGDLVKQLENGQITQLGIVADADHVSGGGVLARWQQITASLSEQGYNTPATLPDLPNSGTVFGHNDGLPSIGLWLAPDHKSDGMLEDLIRSSVVDDPPQAGLLAHADLTVSALPETLFTRYHRTKAVVYSWLAWQRRPGLGLDVTIRGQLLDVQKEPLRGLISWLQRVFP